VSGSAVAGDPVVTVLVELAEAVATHRVDALTVVVGIDGEVRGTARVLAARERRIGAIAVDDAAPAIAITVTEVGRVARPHGGGSGVRGSRVVAGSAVRAGPTIRVGPAIDGAARVVAGSSVHAEAGIKAWPAVVEMPAVRATPRIDGAVPRVAFPAIPIAGDVVATRVAHAHAARVEVGEGATAGAAVKNAEAEEGEGGRRAWHRAGL